MNLSVVLPTHNPRPEFLERTSSALRAQTLAPSQWELLVVDNASAPPVDLDLTWHPAARVIAEPKLGLTAARLAGFAVARGDVLVLVDDDNVLAPDYLFQVLAIAQKYPRLGTWSGQVRLIFQPDAIPPPSVWREFLAERQCSQAVWSNDPAHHASTPWGAGLCVRREVASAYAALVANDSRRLQLDLQGKQLVYGGDTDIAYVGCEAGFGKGVFPQLQLDHLIPATRCAPDYLRRCAAGHAYSEYLHSWMRTGRLPAERPAWRRWLERRRLSPEQRALALAREEGHRRARREFAPPV